MLGRIDEQTHAVFIIYPFAFTKLCVECASGGKQTFFVIAQLEFQTLNIIRAVRVIAVWTLWSSIAPAFWVFTA